MDSPRSYELFIGGDQYVLYNVSSTVKERPIVIDRASNSVYLSTYDISYYENNLPRSSKIYGIIGTIQLISGRYLMTIDKCELVGNLFGHQIFKVTAASLHPFAKSTNHLNATEMEAESAYISMLSFMLQMEGMYFSNTYDLTVSQQRQVDFGPDHRHMSLFERADRQFLWNHYELQDWWNVLLEVLKTSEVSFNPANYLTPLILGFVGIAKASSSPASVGSVASYAIISRRCVKRAGTRFYARGVDSEGFAANFVETEQIIYLPSGHTFSFVQIRGSVPLFWNQRPNLQYKPSVRLGSRPNRPPSTSTELDAEQREAIQRHFHDTYYLYRYGRVVAVNLLDQKGMEKPLCDMFALASQTVDSGELKYEAFDFHKECRALRWDRLQILIDRLEPELAAMGQLHLRTQPGRESLQDASVESRQRGVFRTNCIDCLDRTNVLQSMLGQRALTAALRDTQARVTTELWPGFDGVFKNMWADHADIISVQYSGTRALKTDFTRTGKRTTKGALMDGYHSAVRYYLNNFADGFRQDAFNLFLGHYRVFSEADGRPKLPLPRGPPPSDGQSLRKRFLPLFLAFSTSMSFLCLLFPSVDLADRLVYFIFWGVASGLSATLIFKHGEEFVDKPVFPMQ